MKREIAINPMTELRFNGVEVLKQKLNNLDLDEIQFIIKEHDYDPFKMLTKKEKNDKQYLIGFLVERASNLCKLGRVFRVDLPRENK